ncbi:MAG: hypothetical protein HYY37_00225 [Candidatus Aenigmarchaeota archaeon]|nr:hypothetical protein [Candidatus Aenigmarchaeota archaeon]
MKHIAVWFVLSLVLVSVLVFARDDERQGRFKGLAMHEAKKVERLGEARVRMVEKLNATETRAFAQLSRAHMKELSSLPEGALKSRLAEVRMVTSHAKRVVGQAMVQSSRGRYAMAKGKFMERRQAVAQDMQQFAGLKERYTACKNATGDDCAAVREKAINHSRQVVVNTADMLILHLTKIQEQVTANININDTDAAAITADIDARVAELEAAKAQAAVAATKDEVKSAAETVRSIWKRAEHRAQMHAYRVVRAHVGEILVRAEKLEKKMDALLTFAEERNVSVNDLHEKLDAFSAKVAESRAAFKDSQVRFQAALAFHRNASADGNVTESEATAITNAVKEARRLAQQAHGDLREAHAIFVVLAKDIRGRISVPLTDEQLTSGDAPLPAAAGSVDTTVEATEIPLEGV